jgi:rhamnogalacturonyl hydrolase YesR
LCIDAVYHLPATYALAARWRDDTGLAREAVRVALDAMDVLACPAGWAQWYDPAHKRNNQVAWSRGLGWAVLGLLDLMTLLGERAGDEVAEVSARVLERLAATQGPDGNWPAVLDHPPAAAETSTAAFYVAAALHPAAGGLVALPARVLERAAAAVWRAVADDGTATGVTADVLPSWNIQTYEHCPTEPSPWGQGAALRALCALWRADGSVKFDSDPGDE